VSGDRHPWPEVCKRLHLHPYKGAPRRQTVSARGDELARRFRGAPSAAPGSCQSTGEQLAVASTSLSAHGPDASSTGRPRCETDMRLLGHCCLGGIVAAACDLAARFRLSGDPVLPSSPLLRCSEAVTPLCRSRAGSPQASTLLSPPAEDLHRCRVSRALTEDDPPPARRFRRPVSTVSLHSYKGAEQGQNVSSSDGEISGSPVMGADSCPGLRRAPLLRQDRRSRIPPRRSCRHGGVPHDRHRRRRLGGEAGQVDELATTVRSR
jgi:hypothetical protein